MRLVRSTPFNYALYVANNYVISHDLVALLNNFLLGVCHNWGPGFRIVLGAFLLLLLLITNSRNCVTPLALAGRLHIHLSNLPSYQTVRSLAHRAGFHTSDTHEYYHAYPYCIKMSAFVAVHGSQQWQRVGLRANKTIHDFGADLFGGTCSKRCGRRIIVPRHNVWSIMGNNV